MFHISVIVLFNMTYPPSSLQKMQSAIEDMLDHQ